MKVIDHIRQAKDTLISFEVLPPLKGRGIQALWDHLDPLIAFKPAFVNVTSGEDSDMGGLDNLPVEPGAVYVMDRGYIDFRRLRRLADQGASVPGPTFASMCGLPVPLSAPVRFAPTKSFDSTAPMFPTIGRAICGA